MPWRGRPLPLKCVFSETVERIDGNFCGKVAIPISCIYPATNPTPSRAKKKQQTNKKKKTHRPGRGARPSGVGMEENNKQETQGP